MVKKIKHAIVLSAIAIAVVAPLSRSLAVDPEYTSRENWRKATGKVGNASNIMDLAVSDALTVTNGQEIVVTHSVMLINPTEASTNTIAAAGVTGRTCKLVNVNGTYSFSIAQTGTFASTAVTVSPTYYELDITSVTTNKWVGE